MLILAFDTSTFQGSAGWILMENDLGDSRVETFAEISAPAKPGHAETLLHRLGVILETGGHEMKDVDLVVFGIGPGTFTGLRIGISTAKGIAASCGASIKGVPTLEAIARSAGVDGLVAPLLDAGRGEIYAAMYRVSNKAGLDQLPLPLAGEGRDGVKAGLPACTMISDERVIPPSRFPDLTSGVSREEPVYLTGSGAQKYREDLAGMGVILPLRTGVPGAYLLALHGLELFESEGPDDPMTLEPNYIRKPDAKLPGERK